MKPARMYMSKTGSKEGSDVSRALLWGPPGDRVQQRRVRQAGVQPGAGDLRARRREEGAAAVHGRRRHARAPGRHAHPRRHPRLPHGCAAQAAPSLPPPRLPHGCGPSSCPRLCLPHVCLMGAAPAAAPRLCLPHVCLMGAAPAAAPRLCLPHVCLMGAAPAAAPLSVSPTSASWVRPQQLPPSLSPALGQPATPVSPPPPRLLWLLPGAAK